MSVRKMLFSLDKFRLFSTLESVWGSLCVVLGKPWMSWRQAAMDVFCVIASLRSSKKFSHQLKSQNPRKILTNRSKIADDNLMNGTVEMHVERHVVGEILGWWWCGWAGWAWNELRFIIRRSFSPSELTRFVARIFHWHCSRSGHIEHVYIVEVRTFLESQMHGSLEGTKELRNVFVKSSSGRSPLSSILSTLNGKLRSQCHRLQWFAIGD